MCADVAGPDHAESCVSGVDFEESAAGAAPDEALVVVVRVVEREVVPAVDAVDLHCWSPCSVAMPDGWLLSIGAECADFDELFGRPVCGVGDAVFEVFECLEFCVEPFDAGVRVFEPALCLVAFDDASFAFDFECEDAHGDVGWFVGGGA